MGKIYIADVFLKIGGTSSQYLMSDGSVSNIIDVSGKANIVSPTFSGTVVLPSTTSIGNISSTEIGYLDGVTSGIQAQLNTKITANTSTNNYIPKVSGTNTFANSRLLDTGTYIGLDVINTPTKDFTLGNQVNRKIGIEESSNTVVGRDLIVEAGRAINYVANANFNNLNQQSLAYFGLGISVSGNVYTSVGTTAYMRTAGVGNFVSLGVILSGSTYDFSGHSNGNVYSVGTAGILMQTNGIGNFNLLQTLTGANAVVCHSNGNVYVGVFNGDIWIQTNGTGAFVALGQTTRRWTGITFNPLNGDVYASVDGGDIYMQTGGTGNFIGLGQTSRQWGQMTVNPTNGNVYVAGINYQWGGTAPIYMQTGGIGNFIEVANSYNSWRGLEADINGNVYACSYGAGTPGIFLQTNDALGAPNLDGGTKIEKAGTGKGTGKSRWQVWTGQKTTSGTDMQAETLRMEVNEEGLVTLPSTNNSIISADVTGKAVVTKEYVSTATATKTYNTYFINSSTGNNTTGVYEDSSKPYATIDYVLTLGALESGDTIYLQNEGGFPLNGQLPFNKNISIISEVSANLIFSANNNTNLIVDTTTQYGYFTINMPNGTITNERSGGTGVYFLIGSGAFNVNINIDTVYWNSSTTFLQYPGGEVRLKAKKISCKGDFVQSINCGEDVYVGEFVCLGPNSSVARYNDKGIVNINKISGTGGYLFHCRYYRIKDISTTGICNFDSPDGVNTTVCFQTSVITGGGIEVGSYYGGWVTFTGIIRYVDVLKFSGNEHVWRTLNMINFSADIGNNTLRAYGANITIENSSIKSLNSPLEFWHANSNTTITLKNSSFEVVNAVTLIGGFNNGTASKIKISGVSTNATSITNVPTAVVTQFTNY
jgi:hypothetical protein